MLCTAIMTADPPTISERDSIATAAQVLITSKSLSVPVVDGGGRYVGMFGVDDMLRIVVPRVAIAGDIAPNLRFIGDDPSRLNARLNEQKERRVGDVIDRNGVTLTPQTSSMEAFRMFCRSQSPLAIVEPASGRLLGTVSCWDVIQAIMQSSENE